MLEQEHSTFMQTPTKISRGSDRFLTGFLGSRKHKPPLLREDVSLTRNSRQRNEPANYEKNEFLRRRKYWITEIRNPVYRLRNYRT